MSWGLLLNSFGLATLVSLLALGMGWGVAVFLVTGGCWKRLVFLVGTMGAFSLPPFLVVNTWLGMLGMCVLAEKIIVV